MIAVLVSIAIAGIAGGAIVLALDPRARGGRLAALSFPIGLGACALAMGVLSAIGVAWSRASVLAAISILLAVFSATAVARGRRAGAPRAVENGSTRTVAWLAGAAVAAMGIGHALFATLAPPGEWDFWAIWGLKGKVFHEAAAVDWGWLERPANEFAHPDYPILVPLGYDFAASLAGSWPERELGLLFTVLAASILLFTAAHLGEATGSPLLAAAGAAALAGPVLSVPIGLADLPLLVFGGIALLESRSAIVDRREGRMPIAAAALALAALTKNEGIALTVATAIAILVAGGARRWSLLLATAPAGAAAACWIALRRMHGLGTDLFGGEPLSRLAAAAASPSATLEALAANPPEHALFWLAAAVAILAAGARCLSRERLLLVALALQLAFFLGAYLVTPHEVAWHVATSWPRLLAQLLIPAAFVAFVFGWEALARPREASVSADS